MRKRSKGSLTKKKSSSKINKNKKNIKHKKENVFSKSKANVNLGLQSGIVKRHPDGFGFFIPNNSNLEDAYVPREQMQGVMSGDLVKAEIVPERGGQRFRARIKEILDHKFKRVAGTVEFLNPSILILKDETSSWGDDLFIKNKAQFKELKSGDYVVAEVTSYPNEKKGFCGEILEILGDISQANMDTHRVLNIHQIPYDFSTKCIQEASKFSKEVTTQDKENRKDLTQLNLITIDGPTAKDFDDAIYVEKNDKGYKLFVAIADVSHYVKPQSAIDGDALLRGNSTYFPNFVAPMLPEVLSNELCSLKPHVERLAFVAEMFLNFEGEILQSQFYEAIIKSKARVTYGEAQEILEGGKIDRFQFLTPMLNEAQELAELLMKKRFQEGSLDMDVPEVIINVDSHGEPVEVFKSVRLFAHRMIEEFMLIANVCVAHFFKKRDLLGIYRVHDQPRAEGLEVLKGYLSQVGEKLDMGSEEKLQSQLTQILRKYKETIQEHILSILTLRSMSQAEYSANNIGHFGLSFDDYTHFTSPIRRYADLIVHRLLKAALMPHKGYVSLPLDKLNHLGTLLSAHEQRSVKAERQIDAIKKARFMKQFVGDHFSGVISSVTKFGVFVLLKEYAVDGLVKLEFLGNDIFEFDPQTLELRGQRTGLSYQIGDQIQVIVSNVDIEQGQIDFLLEGEESSQGVIKNEKKHGANKKTSPGRNSKKRKSNKKNSGSVRKKRVRKSSRKS